MGWRAYNLHPCPPASSQPSYQAPASSKVLAEYLLHDNVQASKVIIEVWNPDLQKETTVTGTTKTIPQSQTPTERDWNRVEFSASLKKAITHVPYIFLWWAWDGHAAEYKNHKPKTAFINRRLERARGINRSLPFPRGAHFARPIGFFEVKYDGHKKAVKELQEVQCWYVDRYGRRYLLKTDWGTEWSWRDDANRVHKENSVLTWDKTKIFAALRFTNAITLFGHGNPTAMGPKPYPTDQTITAEEILKTFAPKGKRLLAGRVRFVAVLGCNTGGSAQDEEGSDSALRQPAAGTIADAFLKAGVDCVMFSVGKIATHAASDFIEKFFVYATKFKKFAPGWSPPLFPRPYYYRIFASKAAEKAKRKLLFTHRYNLSCVHAISQF